METLSKLGPKYGICLLALSCYAWAQTPGNIATFAGNGNYRPPANPTGDGGQATSVALETPSAVAVDASGNLYIADKNDNRVRKVNTSGIITTVAGSGTPGFTGDGGLATSAQLDGPIGVAVDAAGNLYITPVLSCSSREDTGVAQVVMNDLQLQVVPEPTPRT